MTTRSITIDDEVVSLARRYRKEALASLVTVLRDEHAPASSRAQASATLLSYSDGKPSQARQITVADIAGMPDALRRELLHALLVHWQVEMPAQFKAMLKASVDEALRLQAALPKPNRFQRRSPVPPASNQPAIAIRARSSGDLAPPAASLPATPTPALQPPLNANSPSCGAGPGDSSNNLALPDNVRQLPGTRADRPPPFGIRYGLIEDLERTLDTAPSSGGISPDVVRRSALKDPLDPFDPWRRS